MKDYVTNCYDNMTDEYHLHFMNWSNTMNRHAKVIDGIIQERLHCNPNEIKLYDCSCGIGTQAIGLSLLGYKVYASDISENEIKRARLEAEKLNAKLNFFIADFRKINEQVKDSFDVIITFDNSLPHLLELREMYKALENIYLKLNKGGMFLASIMDYDHILIDKPNVRLPYVYQEEFGKRIVVHTWDWQENNIYNLSIYMIKEKGERCETNCYKTKYRAYAREEINYMLNQIGYKKIDWIMPEKSGHGHPIVIAFK